MEWIPIKKKKKRITQKINNQKNFIWAPIIWYDWGDFDFSDDPDRLVLKVICSAVYIYIYIHNTDIHTHTDIYIYVICTHMYTHIYTYIYTHTYTHNTP